MLPADLSPESLEGSLGSLYSRVRVLAETASTNDDALNAGLGGAPSGTVYVADLQTRGRGSHGRRWESPGGDDLYLSCLLRLEDSPSPTLTLAAGLAVAETASAVTGRSAAIKWPNDIWLQGRKVAGILVEARRAGRETLAVIGIGLNVNRLDFGDLSATSLRLAKGHALSRPEVLRDLLAALDRTVTRCQQSPTEVVGEVASHLALLDQEALLDGVPGIVRGVMPDGALSFEVAGVTRAAYAGRLERSER